MRILLLLRNTSDVCLDFISDNLHGWQVIRDPRFQSLVIFVETQLLNNALEFSEQHLANVVWGAAKLRLMREPLFHRVEVSLIPA